MSQSVPNEPTQLPVFKYQPLDSSLDSIRLLILEPTNDTEDSETLRCRPVHTTFLQRPVYTALSYTWGSPDEGKAIYLNGESFLARINLYRALVAIRRYSYKEPRGEVALWADAICIDQSNMAERNYQVGLMDYIYSRAYAIYIWLGEMPPPLQTNICRWSLANDYPNSYSILSLKAGPKIQKDILEWIHDNSYWFRL
jgi:hypothetical protein